MKASDKIALSLIALAALILGIIFLPKINPDLSASLSSGATTFFNGVWVALIVVFWLVIAIVGSIAFVKIRQMMRTQVIYDPKDNRPVRAVIHKGELVQIAPADSDVAARAAQLKQMWAMLSAAASSMKNVSRFLDDYEVVDADESEEDINEIEAVAPTQLLEAPRNIVTMNLSNDYPVPADDFLSGRKLIVGTSGSGKSNTVGAYGEELGRLRVPFVMGDTEDEYQPLCNQLWLPNGVRAGLNDPNIVTVDDAAKFGAYVLDRRLQVILNLQSYEMEEAALVMIGIINGMREWEEQFDNTDRIPCDFILEEAVTWLPQNVKESPLYGTGTFNVLQSTFFNDLVRKGRKRGLGLTLVCQKIAELDKRAMQSDAKILHRQMEINDFTRYARYGITPDEAMSLGKGECFLFTNQVSKMRVQIRRRFSPHGADTPGIEALRKQRNFGENNEISEATQSAFEQDTEPLHANISNFRKLESNGQKQIPEETKDAILDLYRSGKKRTDIQDQLKLNGDEYWMIKAVCNEYDAQASQAEEA